MSTRVDVAGTLAADAKIKPGTFERDCLDLIALWERTARGAIKKHMFALGVGNREHAHPVDGALVPRLIEALSQHYRTPPTRLLSRDGELLEDDEDDAIVYGRLVRDSALDLSLALADAYRQLVRQCVVVIAESGAHGAPVLRPHPPTSVFRRVRRDAADIIDEDHAFLILISGGAPSDRIYQSYEQTLDGWRVRIVGAEGAGVGPDEEQPYAETDDILPLARLPVVQIVDELLAGRAWHPIPQSRLDYALSIASATNDLVYLLQLEASSFKSYSGKASEVPKNIGPDRIVATGSPDKAYEILEHKPNIEGSDLVISRLEQQAALAESLEPDAFSRDRKDRTGVAQQIARSDFLARMARQQKVVALEEQRIFSRLVDTHNLMVSDGSRIDLPLRDDLDLVVMFASTPRYVDAQVAQNLSLKEVAAGFRSPIQHIQEMTGANRSDAIAQYTLAKRDLAAFPPRQNPGSMVQDAGPLPALGEGSATRVRGELHPDLAGSAGGASVIAAVRGGSG